MKLELVQYPYFLVRILSLIEIAKRLWQKSLDEIIKVKCLIYKT